MNTTGLQRQYHKLTARERFSAVLAASLRGDDQEREALMTTAPKIGFSVSHTHGLAEAWQLAAMFFTLRQLDMVALTLQLETVIANKQEEDRSGWDRVEDTWRLSVSVIGTRWKSWRLVCHENGVDPDGMLDGLPGIDTLRLWEKLGESMATSQEEALGLCESAAAVSASEIGGNVKTVESEAAELREFIDGWAQRWE